MGNRITADNLDEVATKNREVHTDMQQRANLVRTNWNSMQISDGAQFAMHILRMYGLIQIPLDNQDWSGAIFVKNGKKIPIINTAQPRANQYYTAWNEIYHLIFDTVLLGRIIDADTVLDDRKAEYFASLMMLGNLMSYYNLLSNMDFISRVFYCMATFRVPYKAVLISLYEEAMQNGNEDLMSQVKQNFDVRFTNIDERFRSIGLDDSIVKPSNVINVMALQSRIKDRIRREPELKYHHDNEVALENIVKEFRLIREMEI